MLGGIDVPDEDTKINDLSVLLVDDEKLVLNAIARTLKQSSNEVPYTIFKANSGEEAVRMISESGRQGRRFSVIVSDYDMQAMNGRELLEYVRENSPLTSRIIASGRHNDPVENREFAHYSMAKPWNSKELVAIAIQGIEDYIHRLEEAGKNR